jgi:hypothetical protein
VRTARIAAKAIRSHWFGRARRPAEAREFSMSEFRLARVENLR